jgi:N-hydroxyarylamine O-acetyltransferase
MKAKNFSLPDYFKRIGYEGTASVVDLPTLREIMRHQLFTVPFENLDVQDGKIVSLVPEDIVEKIVYNPRGGYCYEVNGLFAMALEALGVQYQFVAARPMFYPVRRPKTHMALVVSLNGEQWLFDLGFGSYGIREPMKLDAHLGETQQDHDFFILEKENDNTFILKAKIEGVWSNQYAFDLSPQEWIDFAPANYLNSTHPDAVFVQKLLLVLHRPNGRSILFGDLLKTIEHGEVTVRTLQDHEIEGVLEDTFGLPSSSVL